MKHLLIVLIFMTGCCWGEQMTNEAYEQGLKKAHDYEMNDNHNMANHIYYKLYRQVCGDRKKVVAIAIRESNRAMRQRHTNRSYEMRKNK